MGEASEDWEDAVESGELEGLGFRGSAGQGSASSLSLVQARDDGLWKCGDKAPLAHKPG